jgi:hypothetical protein
LERGVELSVSPLHPPELPCEGKICGLLSRARLDGEGLPGRDRQGAAASAAGEAQQGGIRYAPRPPFAGCRARFLDLRPHRAVRGFLPCLIGFFVAGRVAEMRHGCAANEIQAPPFSLPTLLLLAFSLEERQETERERERVCGTGRGCRIPFDGRPAVYARFGRELMRQESDDFSGERLAESFGQPRVSLVDFGLPRLARGMGMFNGSIHMPPCFLVCICICRHLIQSLYEISLQLTSEG